MAFAPEPYNTGGENGNTWITALENAGYAATEALVNGQSPEEAAAAASQVLAAPAPDSDGERLVRINPGSTGGGGPGGAPIKKPEE